VPGDRLEIGRDRFAVRVRQLGHVLLHLGHAATDEIEIRRVAVLQIGDNVGLAPGSDRTLRRDVGNTPLAFRIGGTRQPHILLKSPQRITRRVTFAAMAGAFDDILPALDLVVGARERHTRRLVEIEELPAAERQPDIEGKADFMLGGDIVALRQRLDICEEVTHILGRHPGIGAVGQ